MANHFFRSMAGPMVISLLIWIFVLFNLKNSVI